MLTLSSSTGDNIRFKTSALSDDASAADDGEDAVYAMDLSPRSVFRASMSLMPLHVYGAVTVRD